MELVEDTTVHAAIRVKVERILGVEYISLWLQSHFLYNRVRSSTWFLLHYEWNTLHIVQEVTYTLRTKGWIVVLELCFAEDKEWMALLTSEGSHYTKLRNNIKTWRLHLYFSFKKPIGENVNNFLWKVLRLLVFNLVSVWWNGNPSIY